MKLCLTLVLIEAWKGVVVAFGSGCCDRMMKISALDSRVAAAVALILLGNSLAQVLRIRDLLVGCSASSLR